MEKLLEDIMAKMFPNVVITTNPQIQDQPTSRLITRKKNRLTYNKIILPKASDKEKILQISREKIRYITNIGEKR